MPSPPRLYTSLDEFLLDELRKLDEDPDEPIDPAMFDDEPSPADDRIRSIDRPSA